MRITAIFKRESLVFTCGTAVNAYFHFFHRALSSSARELWEPRQTSLHRLGENDLSKLSAFDQTLRLLIANKLKDKTDHSNKPTTYTIVQEVLKENDTFELSFEDDAANFTAFTQGEVIAKDDQHAVTAEQTGDCIVFPNADVNIGARALVIARPLENLATNTHKESYHEED